MLQNKKYTYFFSFFILSFHLLAQEVSVIQSSNIKGDSSYYDIYQFNDNEFWIGGEYGILKCLDKSGKLTDIKFPNKGAHILEIAQFGPDRVIILADKGILYFYDVSLDSWEVKVFPKYKNKALYNICVINDKTAYICGGHSRIAKGKRTLPRGFILKTENGGATWKKCYNNPFKMVWDINYEDNRLYAITYSPFGSKILTSINEGKSWKRHSFFSKILIHDMEKIKSFYLVGGIRKGKSAGTIGILNTDSLAKLEETSIFWDVSASNLYTLASGSNGIIAYKFNGNVKWVEFKTPIPKNLYAVKFINSNSAYVVGREKTILRVEWKDLTVID
ncbi:hypothetical protein JYT36_00450 [Bacteroidales bacterium AH-315-N07]|nr:hypothetical protein [Bacteroidales bacterium AH-315-N07]